MYVAADIGAASDIVVKHEDTVLHDGHCEHDDLSNLFNPTTNATQILIPKLLNRLNRYFAACVQFVRDPLWIRVA